MKHVALFLSALSMTLLGSSSLNAQSYCSAPEQTTCDFSECAACVDHPLYPECHPHLVSAGADFLFVRPLHNDTHTRSHRTTFMPGATLSYDYLRPETIYVGVHGETGWVQQNSHKHFAERPSFADVRLGYNFSVINDMGYALISPYAGLGYARSKSHFANTSHIRAGYYTVGVRSRFAMCPNWSIGCDVQGIRTFALHSFTPVRKWSTSEVASHSAGVGSKKGVAKHCMRNRWAVEAALPITYYMGERKEWSIEVAPYASGFTLSRSRTAYGTRLTAGYRF